jgi:transposase InsO family protein
LPRLANRSVDVLPPCEPAAAAGQAFDTSATDEVLSQTIERIWAEHFQVYGVRKVWHQLRREGISVARCTVERLMRRLGLKGVIRGRVVRTTVSDKSVPSPLDRVNRQFHAERPNQL